MQSKETEEGGRLLLIEYYYKVAPGAGAEWLARTKA